ncbi:PREDICTED: neuferricin [Pygoscelis adeliae]|uniref:neuferricin n=1 Tax=Pygoscelis adeliae TaxID=9238 RepID=UPI0004F4D88A|nr:PREDICTED: neuferricin [Pygoscelis adeliae]
MAGRGTQRCGGPGFVCDVSASAKLNGFPALGCRLQLSALLLFVSAEQKAWSQRCERRNEQDSGDWKLVGRFYDENGAPTEALRQAEAAIEEALKFQAESEQRKQRFPPCNSEWSSAKGSRFWCSRQSGGVNRDWTGVPRKLYRPGSRGSHCVCVRTTGPPWGQPDSTEHSDRGDLDNPHLEEYDGCHPLAEQCVLKRSPPRHVQADVPALPVISCGCMCG